MGMCLRALLITAFGLFFSITALCAAPQSQTSGSLENAPKAKVIVWGMPIVTLQGTYQDKSPGDRAEVIKTHILDIPTAPEYNIDMLEARQGAYSGMWIMVNDERVFALMKEDVPENLSLHQFGENTIVRLQEWLARRQAQQSPGVLLRGLLYAGLATVIFFLILAGLLKGRRFAQIKLDGLNKIKRAREKVQIGGIVLVPYLLMLAATLLRILTIFLIALISYLWITYVLRQFPYSKGTGDRLADFILNLVQEVGSAIVGSIPDLIMVVLIFWLARLVNNILKNIFARIETGRLRSNLFDTETAKATRRVITLLVWVFAAIIAYPYIPGSQTEAFKGVSVFIGLMVSLGSAGMVSQVLGGLIVVYSRAFQAGDYVRIGEHEGTVVVVGVLSTKIRTLRQEEISIPNAVLLAQSSTNFSRLSQNDGLVISTTVTIGYDTPWRQVHELLMAAAKECEGIRSKPEPRILQIALSDWYVEYRLNVHIDNPATQLILLTRLHQLIQDQFAAAGVQIMSPHFVAQPEQDVLPSPYPVPSRDGNG